MSEFSVLFAGDQPECVPADLEMPDFFEDLNLNQVIDSVTDRKQEYQLKPYFYHPLKTTAEIEFRQAVFRDLEEDGLCKRLKTFAEKMALTRRYLSAVEKLYYKHHQDGWFLEAALVYSAAIVDLASDLQGYRLNSPALIKFRDFLSSYAASASFQSFCSDTRALKSKLETIQYCVTIRGNHVRVRKFESEPDYSQEVEQVFEKFKLGEVKNFRVDLIVASGMNHVQALIVECVSKLYPEIFKELEEFCIRHKGFLDQRIQVFDREMQFFISYLDFIEKMDNKSHPFCYPKVVTKVKEVFAEDSFDLALANKLVYETTPVIYNGFHLRQNERIIVVSGPNQGGKTTFARMFGQLHYLAALGCPVPGKKAQLFLFDKLFTHFEKEEDIRNLRGKLQDDLFRIHQVLNRATSDSIIIMNEIFTSTTLKDAIFLSKQIMNQIIHLDALCVCVSFIDELTTLGEQVVSMVSTVVPNNPAQRTFKIIRMPADGLSYAVYIAEKYRLSYAMIKERMAS